MKSLRKKNHNKRGKHFSKRRLYKGGTMGCRTFFRRMSNEGDESAGDPKIGNTQAQLALIMQSDPKLNAITFETLKQTIEMVKLLSIFYLQSEDEDEDELNEGNYWKAVYWRYGRAGYSYPANLIDVLNRGMKSPRERHTHPGAFVVTPEILTDDGLKSLNLREKTQLLSCFWNCNINSIYTTWTDTAPTSSSQFGPPLNILIDKHFKSLEKIRYATRELQRNNPARIQAEEDDESIKQYLTQHPDLKEFLDRISIIPEIGKRNWEEAIAEGRSLPEDKLNSWKLKCCQVQVPLCISYDTEKNPATQSKYREMKSKLDAFNRVSEIELANAGVPLSLNEKEFIIKTAPQEEKDALMSGDVEWMTGASLFTVHDKQWPRFEEVRQNPETPVFTASGLSGSTWKTLQLAWALGIHDMQEIFMALLAYFVGCFHHSQFEVIESGIDFSKQFTPDERPILFLTDDWHKAEFFTGILLGGKFIDDTTRSKIVEVIETTCDKKFSMVGGRKNIVVIDGKAWHIGEKLKRKTRKKKK